MYKVQAVFYGFIMIFYDIVSELKISVKPEVVKDEA